MVDGVRGAGGRSKLYFRNGRINGPKRASLQQRLNPTALVVAAAFGAFATVAHANPEGAKVVSGQATISSHGSTLVIKNSPGAIINWQSFSIGAGQVTDFIQQSVNSAILNRVVGADPSVILGTLESNGHVFLVNPNGVVFGKGATVDAAGLVVSSLNITDEDFKNGTLRFVGSGTPGDISVAGVLHSSDGDVYLIAPNVTNTGSITATNGAVVLAAGQDVEILGAGLTDIQFNVQNKSNSAINLGQINGDAVGIFAGTLTQAGGVNANAATVSGGKVVLSALGDVTLASGSSTTADNAGGSAGSVSIQSAAGNISVASGAAISASGASGGTIMLLANGGSDSVTGTVAASGSMGLGGTVDILGQGVTLGSTAALDASGSTGGGQLVIGGLAKSTALLQSSATSVAAGAMLSADATGNGDGGHVVVFGLNTMDMDGSISARGGVSGGNGGLIETSGEVISIGEGAIAANARTAGGKAGTWLLDPGAITIETGGDNYVSNSQNSSTLDPGTIATALNNGTSVVVATSNVNPTGAYGGENDSITVANAISATGVKNGASLSLSAGGDITISAGITLEPAINQAAATLNLNANIEASGGNISVSAPIYVPGGAINASGSGFSNSSTITALNITAVIDTNGAPTPTGFQNSGVIDASGESNGNANGGNVAISSSEIVPSLITGNIIADGFPGTGGAGGNISIQNVGDITVSGATLSAVGATGFAGASGGSGGNITVVSGGVLTVNGGASMSVIGGDGGASTNTDSGDGGFAGSINLTGASVAITGAIFDLYGGAGGTINNPTGYSLAGSGGFGGNFFVLGNAGNVTLLDSSVDASGGGALGGGGNGGTGGSISMSALGALSITGGTYTVSGGSGSAGLSSSTTFGLSDGGFGGNGGSITITGTSVFIGAAGDPTMLLAQGGLGGAGAVGSDANGTASAFDGTNGGAGGNGGGVNIVTPSGGDGALTLNNVTVNVDAGGGGVGGAYSGTTSTLQNTAGYGGGGGVAGAINLTAYGNLSLIDSVLIASGGDGGAGGALTGIDPVAIAGSGGTGGMGGAITLTTFSGFNEGDITLTGANLSVIGGNGGDGGIPANSLGSGGAGGDAGNSTPNVNGSVGIAINLSAAGIVTIDNASSLTSQGGNGGNGASAQGLNLTAYGVVGPGNGGNGGTAGSIYIESIYLPASGGSDTLSNAGNISIIGGNGGNGGDLLSGNIQNNGGPLAAGNGGSAGDAGSTAFESHGTLIMQADNGALLNTGNIVAIGGSGGNGGLSNDQVFGPGTGGNGGAVATVQISADQGINFGGTVNMSGGSGGNGGNVTVTSNNPGGTSGAGGNTGNLEIDANGSGDLTLNAVITYNAGFEGFPGSDTATAAHNGFYGNYGGASTIILGSENGSIIQDSGNFTGFSGVVDISANAADSVSLTSSTNAIDSIRGSADNGTFQVNSNDGLYNNSGPIFANGEIDIAAPSLQILQGINSNSAVNLTATGTGTNGTLYINASVGGSNINLIAGGLLTLDAGSILQAAENGQVTIDVMALNVSTGASILATSGIGTLLVTSYNDSGPIYLTGDSYGVIDSGTSGSELILGSEFFNAINFSAIQIGDSSTPAITAQSFAGSSGTITIKPGVALALTAGSIMNDALTTISTDQLVVVSNAANLSGLTTTSGGPLALAGSALNSQTASLSVTMAGSGSILVSDVYGGNDSGTLDGLTGYNSVTLLGSSVHLNDFIENGGAQNTVTLGSNNPSSVIAVGGTGYTWDLSQSDVNQIYADNIVIGAPGQSGQIVVAGPVTVPTYTNVTAVTLATTGGGISLLAGSLNVGSASLTLDANGSGSITDAGNVSISGGSISLVAAGAIGSVSAPIVLRTPGVFGATAFGGGAYIDSQGSLYTEGQGISASGNVVVSAAGLDNYGTISGDAVTINAGGFFGSSGTVHGGSGIDIDAGIVQTLASSVIAANGDVNLTGTSMLEVQGLVFSNSGVNLSGGAISLTSTVGSNTLVTGTDITIAGSSLSVVGGSGSSGTTPTTATYSTGVTASGTLNVTISGNMTVTGGDTANGSAALVSGGDSVYQIGGNLNMSGGTANGAFALLDPTNGGQPASPGTTMTITANQVNLTGGSVPNAYAAIVATGNVVFNAAQQVTLTQGSQPNADAVVISKTGTITANTPNCVNCTPEKGTNPLLNSDVNQGFYGGLATAPPPAAPPPAAPPPAPAPVATGGTNGLGDPANDTLIQDLLTLLDIPLDARTNPPIDGLIFVDGGVDGCF